MSCKYPETSRSYKFCICCRDNYLCDESTTPIPEMPNVTPPIGDDLDIEKAIKLLIDNGYSVVKNQNLIFESRCEDGIYMEF